MDSALLHDKAFCTGQCPQLIRDTLDLIAPKWTVPIFLVLHTEGAPLRYAELQRRIGAITPKELAKHLRLLEAGGLIRREVFPTVPPRVEYALTALGLSLYPALESLAHWALRHGDAVARHRADSESA